METSEGKAPSSAVSFTLTKRAFDLLQDYAKVDFKPGKIKDTFNVTAKGKDEAVFIIAAFTAIIANAGQGCGKFANPKVTSSLAAIQRIRIALGYKGDVRHYNHTR